MDVVDESNLQRQILHNLDRVGESQGRVGPHDPDRCMNPDLEVMTFDERLGADNIMEILAGFDVVVDGADNFPSRYLLNDASVKLGIPVVHGSIFRFEGQVTVFDPAQRADLPRPAARAATAGAGPQLRRGRCPRRPARDHRVDPGARGDQADPRPWRLAARSTPGLRRPGDDLPGVQAQHRPGQRGHPRQPGADQGRRVGGPVRSPALDPPPPEPNPPQPHPWPFWSWIWQVLARSTTRTATRTAMGSAGQRAEAATAVDPLGEGVLPRRVTSRGQPVPLPSGHQVLDGIRRPIAPTMVRRARARRRRVSPRARRHRVGVDDQRSPRPGRRLGQRPRRRRRRTAGLRGRGDRRRSWTGRHRGGRARSRVDRPGARRGRGS